ncbi:hypothetical protein [Photobacterium leiognathi]|uniref:hypothetical protein n=1 Tax=Photobacterium leiognathi TaxID=553611 RepID=UPI002980C6EB|nr:hypothetical protein [Photobacterium leiognathi]
MTEKQLISQQIEKLSKQVDAISAQLNTTEEDKWKAACEMQSKIFEHERAKSAKIEDKAYKLITYLVILLPAFVSFFAWYMANVNPKIHIILIVKDGHVNAMLTYGHLAAIILLLISIFKTVMILRAREEYNPVTSVAEYHAIDHPERTAKDVFQSYSKKFSSVSETRRENNRLRGLEYQGAFLWSIWSTLFACLIGGITLFFYLKTL